MDSIRHFARTAKKSADRAYLSRLADYADAHRREVESMPEWARKVAVGTRVPVSSKVDNEGLKIDTWKSKKGSDMSRVHWIDGSTTQYEGPLDRNYIEWYFGIAVI